jgi:hypothetical protein
MNNNIFIMEMIARERQLALLEEAEMMRRARQAVRSRLRDPAAHGARAGAKHLWETILYAVRSLKPGSTRRALPPRSGSVRSCVAEVARSRGEESRFGSLPKPL